MAEAAAYSGLSASHLRLLARTRTLQAWKLGQDWFTTRKAVDTYLRDEARRKKGPRKQG
jgi:excisionase family DNA binding protein